MNEFIISVLILVVVIYLISKKIKKEPLKNFGVKTSNKITGRPFKIGNLEVAQNNFPEDINWTEAKKVCDTLGEGWRLPSKDELNILFDINKVNDILCLGWKRYWTHSEGISRTMKSGMWTQETVFGDQNTYSKLKLVRVRAVRDSEPKELLAVSTSIIMSTPEDPNDIIGTPFKIGNLEVAQNDFPKEMRYVDAIKECEVLGDGWRLPTKTELNILYKNQDKIGGFVHFVYWSSSPLKDDGRYRWRQEFSFGSQGGANDGDKKLFFSYARAVRDKK